MSTQELYDKYLAELNSGIGFGNPSRWLDDKPRNFAQWLAERRINEDLERALKLI